MGVEIASRYVTIYPTIAKGFSTEINAAVSKGATQGGKAVGSGIESGVKQAAPKVGQTFKSVMAPVLTGAALVSILQFVRKSVDAYSQLEDATAAAGVTFGNSMSKITKASESAAKSLGISKQEYVDGAITMGTFGKSAGLVGDDLANFSTQMVQTAGDMASFRGTTPEQAIEAVGAALRGETEPIRQYGVLLDDASLRQQALAMGLTKTTKEALTPQQRVLAAQAAILKQTSDAQGDFARTSDSTANTQKMLAAESANLSAEIGQKLAPAIVAAQRAGIGMIQWATDNQNVLIPLISTLGVAALAVGGFVLAVKGIEAVKAARATVATLQQSFVQLQKDSPRAAAGLSAVSRTAKVASVALAGLGVAAMIGQQVQANIDRINGSVSVMGNTAKVAAGDAGIGALDKQFGKIQQKFFIWQTGASAVSGVGDALKQVADGSEGFSGFMNTTSSWIAGMTGTKTALGEVGAQISNLDSALAGMDSAQAAQVFAQITAEADKQGISVERLKQLFPEYTSAVDASASATKSVAGEAKTAAQHFGDYKKSLTDTYDAQLKLRGDKRALEAAIDDASEAVKKNGRTLDINTEKGRANQEALDQIASAAKSVMEGMTDADVASGKAGRVMAENRKRFIEVATAMTGSKKRARELANELGLLPAKKVIPVTLDVIWKGKLSSKISVDGTGAGKISLKADGGPISGGVRGKDSVPALLTPDEHVLTTSDVRNLGGHDGVFRMRSLAASGLLRFAGGGPVMPSYKGHSLEWWQDYLLSDVESTQLQIQIRDLKASLRERETYTRGKRKLKRLRLRGLDRTEAALELRDAENKWKLSLQAKQANKSAAGTISQQLAKHEAAQKAYEDSIAMWQDAAASLTKSTGFGSLDAIGVQMSNAVGDKWVEKKQVTAADLAQKVTDQAQQVQTFINILGKLRKAGASEALISDVISLGTVEGIKAAKLFLADATQMAIANQAYAKLESAQSALTAIGNSPATEINVTVNEAATPEATKQAVLNGILTGLT